MRTRSRGVDRSYLSRIVSGERSPSWNVTRELALACDADPVEPRPLWDAARGLTAAQPTGFHAALRGMNLAAGRPTPTTLRTRTGNALSEADVTGLLNGTHVTEWPLVARLITAVGAHTDTIHPQRNPPVTTPTRQPTPPHPTEPLHLLMPPAFEAFHTLHHPLYLSYAHAHLNTRAAQTAVRTAFGVIATHWPYVLPPPGEEQPGHRRRPRERPP
ncbi:helix-turn-helix domain-containing protein [Streptomyces sp. NPDC020965]|uniref:helix-turn-helix domain-containing protein n=1 Tax=Streptomyces sp. NPDC020965 TaxID=3365105 RepID=UPI00379975C3